MKKLVVFFLVLFSFQSIFAARIMNCLEPLELVEYSGRFDREYNKVSITKTSKGVLRGNFTQSGMGQMNYSSITIEQISDNQFVSTGPSETIKNFELEVGSEKETVTVVDYVDARGETKIVDEVTFTGYKSKLVVKEVFETTGIVVDVKTTNLVCASPKLRVKKTRK